MPNVNLRPLTLTDTGNIVRWRNQDFVRFQLYNYEKLTEAQHTAYFNKYVSTGLVAQYVLSAEDGTDIGTVFFKNIDRGNNKAEIGIFIGEENYLRGGYGTEALRQAARLALEELKLNKLYATIKEENISSRKAFIKAGFVEAGLLLEDYLGDEGYGNVYLMELTKNIWNKNKET